jgi:hypothetical protein
MVEAGTQARFGRIMRLRAQLEQSDVSRAHELPRVRA